MAFTLQVVTTLCLGCNKKAETGTPPPAPRGPHVAPVAERFGQLKRVGAVPVPTGSVGQVLQVRPDGQEFALSGSDGSVLLVPKEGGAPRVLIGHREPVLVAAWTPDGQKLLTAGQDNQIIVWDARTGQILQQRKAARGDIKAIAASPDGQLGATGSVADDVSIWRLSDGERLQRLEGHTMTVTSVVFSPTGKHLFSGSRDATVRRWNIVTGKPEGRPLSFKNGALALFLSPQGATPGRRSLYMCGVTGELAQIDLSTFQITNTRRLAKGRISACAIAPSGQIAVGDRGGRIQIFGTSPDRKEPLVPFFSAHPKAVLALQFEPDGSLVSLGADARVAFWDPATGDTAAARQTLPPINGVVRAVTANPKGTRVAITSQDTLLVADARRPAMHPKTLGLGNGGISALAWTPDGALLLVGRGDGHLLTLRDGALPVRRDVPVHKGAVRHIVPSGDGKSIWTAGDDIAIRQLDSETLAPLTEITCHTSPIIALAADAAGRWLASSEEDHITFIRAVGASEPHWTRRGHIITHLAFSPGGDRIIMVENHRKLMLYDVQERREIKKLRTTASAVTALMWHPSGEVIITLDELGAVRVWDAEGGAQLGSGDAGRGRPNSLCVADNGRLLITGGMDPRGSAKVFEFPNLPPAPPKP